VRHIHRFALKPDAVFYLRIGVDELIPRAVFSRGFDYWESGMDLYASEDMFDSFRRYQAALLEQFDHLAEEFSFRVIDARPEPKEIFERLREGIQRVLAASDAPKTAAAPSASAAVASADAASLPSTVDTVSVAVSESGERAEDVTEDRRKKA
jgi:dTMP kinase